jgi:CRISPR type I-E-associated protein CasB/Cse2
MSEKLDQRVKRLGDRLIELARTSDTRSESRAALAELRQAFHNPLRAAKHVVPCFGNEDRDDEHWFYLIASLFALQRNHTAGVSLGSAFRQIKDDSGSIEGRFVALLSAPADQLPERLRSAVTLLESRKVGLDWYRLLSDVLGWEWEGKPKQRALARDFYRVNREDNSDATPSVSATGEE